ncbi:MAG: hypothetical protein JSV34_05935 [Candidatus Omnitrophota bacterium]|nr:MAG: hypothetical protein JSV34_05935 [Candidatus Omnitrophota bacterium]
MKLPRDNYRLTEVFKTAGIPSIYEFEGEYVVDMLTVLPSLRKFRHRKVFYTKNSRVLGYNIIFNQKIWGHFFVEEGICPSLGLGKAAVINYDRAQNSSLTNKIRDYIRRLDKATFLGRFMYLVLGRQYFLGYFSLSKVM